MGTRKTQSAAPGIHLDKRGSTDRRSSARTAQGGQGGRRVVDDEGGRSSSVPDQDADMPRKRRATQDGRQPLMVYLRRDAIKSLKIEAVERDTTASAIVGDAVDDWFRAHGRLARR